MTTRSSLQHCRFCSGPPEVFLFEPAPEASGLDQLLAKFANVEISENDGKPSHLCLDCTGKLKSGVAFQRHVQEVEKLLESISDSINESVSIKNEIEEEDTYEVEFLEDFTNDEGNNKDFSTETDSQGEAEDEENILQALGMEMDDDESEEDKDIVKFPFEMPEQNMIAQRIEFEDFEYLEIDGDRCCGCSFIAADRDQLVEHSKERHSHNYYADSSYTCPTCYQKFTTQEKLSQHIEYFSFSDIFLCRICNESFVQKSHCSRHIRTHTTKSVDEVKTPRRTTRPARVTKVSTDKTNSFCCCFVRCWQSFPSEAQLMDHVHQSHDGKRRENELARAQEPQSDDPPLICQTCQRSFESEPKLQQHQTYKQQRSEYPCPLCDAKFYKLHRLRDHQERAHSLAPPVHVCETCGKAFHKLSVLKHHRKIHTPFEAIPCSEPDCQFVFRDAALMKRHHRNVHGANFPWECQHCPKKLRTKEALDLHVRMHTGEKPFGCRHPPCERRFAHATDRARHERSIHTGVKPHQCEHCAAAFARRRELLIHVAKIHPTENEK
ncbi:hypothetical protein quinque_011644 [Culex quinquefasciatus]|uniref:zinc finger protein 420 n=1 Tax=Culex quinquefasciatus TaxID=7176 RepID=UPI0018E2D754|nr:zinc finger protein 420 [Culex quinquefasciatus]